MDELLHHWSKLPLLSYFRPVQRTSASEMSRMVVSGVALACGGAFTVTVEAVRQLVSDYHTDGSITQRSGDGKFY